MSKEKALILEIGEKCKISIDKEGVIYTKDCPDLELGNMDIDMFGKIKDIIKEPVKIVFKQLPKQIKTFPKIERRVGRPRKRGRPTKEEEELRMEYRSGAGRFLPQEIKFKKR